MRATLAAVMKEGVWNYAKASRSRWILDSMGMVTLAGSQVRWRLYGWKRLGAALWLGAYGCQGQTGSNGWVKQVWMATMGGGAGSGRCNGFLMVPCGHAAWSCYAACDTKYQGQQGA